MLFDNKLYVHTYVWCWLVTVKLILVFSILYLSVCEEKYSILFLYSSHLVDLLEVLMKGVVVVASSELNLKALVRAHVSC